jgi:hypothetical protein
MDGDDMAPRELRGLRLLAAHLRNLDPEEQQARLRLDEELGSSLTWKLLFALASGGGRNRRAA